jgi:hypothetical protein
MLLRRKRLRYKSPDEIALHNAEAALRSVPEGGGRWQRWASTATAVVVAGAAIVVGALVLAENDSASGSRNSAPIRLGPGGDGLSSSTFLDSRGRVCTTLRKASGETLALLAGARCAALSPLAFRLDANPAFVTGVAVDKSSIVLHGFAQIAVGKIFFRRQVGRLTELAPAWRPDPSGFPGLTIKPFLIRAQLDAPLNRSSLPIRIRDHLPNIYCTIGDGHTRVTVHPDLRSVTLTPPAS